MHCEHLSGYLILNHILQSDDGTVPLLSVPRSSISENPFTSLLLCSCVHSTVFTFERYAVLWCQNLALEVNITIFLSGGILPPLKAFTNIHLFKSLTSWQELCTEKTLMETFEISCWIMISVFHREDWSIVPCDLLLNNDIIFFYSTRAYLIVRCILRYIIRNCNKHRCL